MITISFTIVLVLIILFIFILWAFLSVLESRRDRIDYLKGKLDLTEKHLHSTKTLLIHILKNKE